MHAVWVDQLGGVTFRVGSDISDVEYIKVAKQGAGANTARFTDEARRLRSAGTGLWRRERPGSEPGRGLGVALHRGVPGLSAVHPRWLAWAKVAARAIGAGLRTLHDRLPVRSCPFDWSAASRLSMLAPARRVGVGEPPPVDQLVVCHGDACSPNTAIGDDGP